MNSSTDIPVKLHRMAIAIGIMVCLNCCSSNYEKVENALADMTEHPVVLPLEKMQCRWREKDTVITKPGAEFKMVIYIDSSGCSPCAIDRLYQWNNWIKSPEYNQDTLDFIFIVAPKRDQLEDVRLTVDYCGLQKPVFIDTTYVFRQINKYIPDNKRFHTFMLDRNDSIVVVGNPFENEQLENLIKRELQTKIASLANDTTT